MTELTTILKSKTKLIKAVQPLKDSELLSIIDKIQLILKERETIRLEKSEAEALKQKKVNEYRALMKADGITIDDFSQKKQTK